jgi:hypothetical protein
MSIAKVPDTQRVRARPGRRDVRIIGVDLADVIDPARDLEVYRHVGAELSHCRTLRVRDRWPRDSSAKPCRCVASTSSSCAPKATVIDKPDPAFWSRHCNRHRPDAVGSQQLASPPISAVRQASKRSSIPLAATGPKPHIDRGVWPLGLANLVGRGGVTGHSARLMTASARSLPIMSSL